jgi:NAD-dependent deacetylase
MVTDEVQQIFNDSRRIVFLTGPGVSSASGIPDFRSKQVTVHKRRMPTEFILSTETMTKEPAALYEFVTQNLYCPNARPNIIHDKIAEFVNVGRAKVVTQNIDGLQLNADIDENSVIEILGNVYRLEGTTDFKRYSPDRYLESMFEDGRKTDHDIIRPMITLYGEQPFQIDTVQSWLGNTDLVVVVGGNLSTFPFSGLLNFAPGDVPIFSINSETLTAPPRIKQIVGDAISFFTELKV